MRKLLAVISFDLAKAYGFEKKEKDVLKTNKIDPHIINLSFIAEEYVRIRTKVEIGKEYEVEIKVTSGIKKKKRVAGYKLHSFNRKHKIIQKLKVR